MSLWSRRRAVLKVSPCSRTNSNPKLSPRTCSSVKTMKISWTKWKGLSRVSLYGAKLLISSNKEKVLLKIGEIEQGNFDGKLWIFSCIVFLIAGTKKLFRFVLIGLGLVVLGLISLPSPWLIIIRMCTLMIR